MSIRTEKVASVIKRALAEPLRELASEYIKGSLATVTSVRMSKDLRIANVYLSIYGKNSSPGKFLTFLESMQSSLRSEIGAKVRLRYTPELRFFIDDTLDQIEHIQNLLKSVDRPDAE